MSQVSNPYETNTENNLVVTSYINDINPVYEFKFHIDKSVQGNTNPPLPDLSGLDFITNVDLESLSPYNNSDDENEYRGYYRRVTITKNITPLFLGWGIYLIHDNYDNTKKRVNTNVDHDRGDFAVRPSTYIYFMTQNNYHPVIDVYYYNDDSWKTFILDIDPTPGYSVQINISDEIFGYTAECYPGTSVIVKFIKEDEFIDYNLTLEYEEDMIPGQEGKFDNSDIIKIAENTFSFIMPECDLHLISNVE